MEYNIDLALSDFSKELKLLIKLLRIDNLGNLDIDEQDYEKIDWDKFLELVIHHRVYPSIIKNLKMLDDHNIPSFVIQTLNKYYQKNTFKMLHLCGEMERICGIFSDNNIRNLILKGPVLAADLYGDISLRTSKDLDILIDIHNLDGIEEILLIEGYEKLYNYRTVLNDWRWRQHNATFINRKKNINLEIHWRLSRGPSMEPSFNELWERKRRASLTDGPVYHLGLEDLFLYLVTHGARHGWFRLRWLNDIREILKQDLNWKRVNLLFKKYQYLNIGGQSLILVSDLLGAVIPYELKHMVQRKKPYKLAVGVMVFIKGIVDPPVDYRAYFKKYLFSMRSTKQKVYFLLSLLYPFPIDVETLPLSKSLHFLYIPLRPILWVWRKSRKHVLP